jgi:hypothetical protein
MPDRVLLAGLFHETLTFLDEYQRHWSRPDEGEDEKDEDE